MVFAHGHEGKILCAVCKTEVADTEAALFKMSEGVVCYCKPCLEQGKKSPVKPSVVWFGERMPERFFSEIRKEVVQEIDLLVIMGTSLKVKPFC